MPPRGYQMFTDLRASQRKSTQFEGNPMDNLQSIPPVRPKARPDQALRQAAQELETTFLTEMLKATGVGKAPSEFNGGAGEDQFNSFLVRAQAEAMVQGGGVGLAESLFESLKERGND